VEKILFYFTLFIIYSILGAIIENIYCSYKQKKIILNRGFLIGPYCPVYGITAMLMVLFLKEYEKDIFILFFMSIVYASLVEYLTSYIMEKVFNARWWDYSNKKYNIEGRICLENSLMFGICGLVLIKYINPFILSTIKLIPTNIFNIISIILSIIFITDVIISITIVSKLKTNVSKIKKDSTNDIDRQVKEYLKGNNIFKKRIFSAFPKLRFNNDKTGEIIKSIKSRIDEIDNNMLLKKQEIINLKKNIKNLKKKHTPKDIILTEKIKLKDLRRKKV